MALTQRWLKLGRIARIVLNVTRKQVQDAPEFEGVAAAQQ
jgi:hypothetical protein